MEGFERMEDINLKPVVLWKNNCVFINGKFVGRIANGAYLTERDSDKHFFRKRQGFPIDVEILDELKKRDCKTIIIHRYHKDENTGAKVSDEVKEFTVDEYNAEPAFRERIKDGWQKCVRWDRELPKPDPQTKLFFLKFSDFEPPSL